MVFNSFRVRLRALLEDIFGLAKSPSQNNPDNSKSKKNTGKLKLVVKLKTKGPDICCDNSKKDARKEASNEPIRKI